MMNTTAKKIKYELLEEIVNDLKQKINYLSADAKDDLECCKDEESGEINQNSWRYDAYVQKTQKVEIAEQLIKEFEKM